MEQLVRDVVDSVNERNADKIIELTHPDVEFLATIARAEGRRYRGRQGFAQFFSDVDDTFSSFEIALRGWEELQDDVLLVELVMTAEGRSSGVPIVQPVWQLWTLRDGVPWRNEAFSARELALEAAGLSD